MFNKKKINPKFIILFLIIIIVLVYIFFFKSNVIKIYVANEGEGTISVVNAESLKVIKTIKLDGMPHNVNVDPLGRYFYATNHEEDEHSMKEHIPYLRILDAKKDVLLKSIKLDNMAAHVVPNKQGSLLYVSIEGGNTIVEVDINKAEIVRSFNVGEGPHGFVMSNTGSKLYVPNMRSNDISLVDINSGKEERIKLELNNYKCETPVAMGITNDDKYSFVTCGKSFEVYKIDNTNKKVVGIVKLEKGEFPGPIQIPVHKDNKYLYVPDMYHGVVHKIYIEPFEFIKDIKTGKGSHGIAYSSDGKTAYVTNTYENTLSVIDLESDKVIKTLNVGMKPNGVAVSNGKNQGW